MPEGDLTGETPRLPGKLRHARRERLRHTCLDLFSGAGGLSEGFRQAGFHTVAANDADAWAGATYKSNHEQHGTKFVLGDITSAAVKEELPGKNGYRYRHAALVP